MLSILTLAFGFLAAGPPENPANASDLATYQDAKARVGRDPDAHIKLALWCEAHGLQAERLKHLALAVLIDPRNASARGLLGLVAYRDHWRRPEAVIDQVRADAGLSATLAEYNARREKMDNTPQAHWTLGLWCEEHGLKPEAEAHFTAVTRLSPNRSDAWRKLGCQSYKGRWLRPEQVAAEKAEEVAQAKADRYWTAKLDAWKLDLMLGSTRAQADRPVVDDPRAVRAIGAVLCGEWSGCQGEAIRLLSRIDGPAASQLLASLAVSGDRPEDREEATEILARRDPRESVDFLIGLLHDPIRYKVRHVRRPGSAGVLLVEGEDAKVRRVFRPHTPSLFANPQIFINPNPSRMASYFRSVDREWKKGMEESARNAEQALLAEVEAIESKNEAIDRQNERAAGVLGRITGLAGLAYPGTRRGAWAEWWAEQVGSPYERPEPRPKPTLTRYASVPPPSPRYVSASSCFVAGTPVLTRDGLRPIETLRVGDLVLSQDTTSGALGFQPVVAVLNRVAPTVRLRIADETIEATQIHRFWKAGQGWIMARDLKPGDVLRTYEGLATVSAVEPEPGQKVFNLEVGTYQTFFVGRSGALVHDNRLPPPGSVPFDAIPDLAANARSGSDQPGTGWVSAEPESGERATCGEGAGAVQAGRSQRPPPQ